MTTVQEPTTTAEVPAWLNLAAIVPPDDQAAIERTLIKVKRELDTIRDIAQGIRMWVAMGEELVGDLPSDVGEAVLAATGITELHNVGFDIGHLFPSEDELSNEARDELLGRLDQIDSDNYAEVQQ